MGGRASGWVGGLAGGWAGKRVGGWWVRKQRTSGQAVGCVGKELHQWVGKQGNRQKGRFL